MHIKGGDLTCPVEFSMTCTSGILVDIFPKLKAAKWGKGNQKKDDSSVSSAHLTTV